MNSIWKDLLFLHGHLLHKEDLDWRADPPAKPTQCKDVATTRRTVLACCANVWPRIMGLR
jgi:hypothetical protein